ncbi:hypothetical protein TSOC_014082 [Tetrabaena socialis]|uniref:Uncharacterized protein n=1 Tax=Tetrabaena socialis TaxID=47790 RepID=A0A2J7ZIL5_9CHLO|nr:hypothetical protein TSOC_014082 [Tetrabaena socialis]|eukprot:PNH00111.1 hypothetical protein TSOC_014082 [Tetrabaena socialis]
MWSPAPLSLATLPLGALLLLTASWRARIQRRVAMGGVPFPAPGRAGVPPGPTAHKYFATSSTVAVTAWVVHAWVASLLVLFGVWAAAAASLASAATTVKPPYIRGPLPTAGGTEDLAAMSLGSRRAVQERLAALAAAGAAADLPDSAWARVGWGPDFPGPGGKCPPTCIDLSSFAVPKFLIT